MKAIFQKWKKSFPINMRCQGQIKKWSFPVLLLWSARMMIRSHRFCQRWLSFGRWKCVPTGPSIPSVEPRILLGLSRVKASNHLNSAPPGDRKPVLVLILRPVMECDSRICIPKNSNSWESNWKSPRSWRNAIKSPWVTRRRSCSFAPIFGRSSQKKTSFNVMVLRCSRTRHSRIIYSASSSILSSLSVNLLGQWLAQVDIERCVMCINSVSVMACLYFSTRHQLTVSILLHLPISEQPSLLAINSCYWSPLSQFQTVARFAKQYLGSKSFWYLMYTWLLLSCPGR